MGIFETANLSCQSRIANDEVVLRFHHATVSVTYPYPVMRQHGAESMLNTAQISLMDVMNDRRNQLNVRLCAGFTQMVCCGLLLGWEWSIPLMGAYIGLQWLEVLYFIGKKPRFRQDGCLENAIALSLIALSSILFGASTMLLGQKLGAWGDVTAAFLLCGTILNSVLTTIGCLAAFQAAVFPYLVYFCVLPFSTLSRHNGPSMPVLFSLVASGIFLMVSIWQLWQRWSHNKAAEITAVRRYVAERDANEERLLRLTQQDALTGLLNRDVLQAQLARNAKDRGTGALLLIDLDGFKYVNDTLGHSAGDLVLREISSRIQLAARATDTAARMGGDEFALLLPGVTDPAVAFARAEALIAEISQPVFLEGQPINIGASIGIAIHPLHGEDAEQLFANADLALYQAKAEGRHCARAYNAGLRVRAQGKVLRDTELRLALERGEFEMFYQPQIRLADGALTGAEALLRWRHPEQGLLSPADFLHALEGGLLSARVGAWVIDTACRQAALWRKQGAPDFRIGVNIFGAQFRSGNLVDWVLRTCTAAGLPPAALEIEITENVILRHEDEIIGPLQELRALGVGVAFDDYGTGFASLSMLTRFPVSRLKIDRSFTSSICDSVADAAVIQAVIKLARALSLEVTAEGIETQVQAHALAREGCDEGQGYYFGRPMSAAAFAQAFCFGVANGTGAVSAIA